MQETKVVVGAEGYNNNPGWLHTNEEELNLLRRETWLDKFQSNSLSVILAERVWEHLSYEEGIEAAKICYEFLKDGGYIRCAVPDAYFLDEEYQRGVQVGGPGPLDHPAASHKIVHNYKTITSMFESAGFQVRILEYCDENGEFHYNDWNEKDGFIYRSKRFDHRNQDNKLGFVSLIVDAIKNEK
ncbi:SAM-dependent methyltransferase [Bacillus hominis]|uniref:SAM-dependent methyltransferase n=1 Tax=Bacillus hominis TaxID=2817478 RepID=A0ABT7R2P0_9BACI|nr:SAM-dependent methyltransferase [Bacillus hominis]MDM5192031.1 SAM-dependent methyltransferase [Bacillus hominis]MDM5431761.1 SAM-dependent methyltransferase [Bacillus hominis]MDM5437196.1 SAM-dependent methyltransferase [Bacillus hominis]